MDTIESSNKRLSIVSDFNIDVLRGYLANLVDDSFHVCSPGFNQLHRVLSETELMEDTVDDTSLVWARPESVSAGIQRALSLEPVKWEDIESEVDLFAEKLLRYSRSIKYCFVASFVLSFDDWGYGILDWRPGLGIRNLLSKANLHLASRLAESSNVFLLDAERWLMSGGNANPKLWYAAKLPFSNSAFKEAAKDVKAALDTLGGRSRRLILVDLDETLWGGVVGESGWQSLRLGGLDHIGEAFKSFQAFLKAQANRGVQLAIVSKNEEAIALDAIDNHPEMLLRKSDFAGWRINWNDKAANIVELLNELNLGAGSAVFIDDNPVERDRVRLALPQVLVPEWPSDPCQFRRALENLRCFDTASVTEEDRSRTQMYVQERARRETVLLNPEADWLEQMGTVVLIERVSPDNIARVEQLFNKTNQMNLSTRRLSSSQILDWCSSEKRSMFAASISDKFGSIGLSALVSFELNDGTGEIVDFLLSCRVIGRKIEETILHFAFGEIANCGGNRAFLKYALTSRNAPMLKFLERSGLTETDGSVFTWDLTDGYPRPSQVRLELRVGA